MTKILPRPLVPVLLALTGALFVDQGTKEYAGQMLHAGISAHVGPVYFTPHYNQGALLGLWGQLPPVIRVVSFSTLGVFLLFLFTVFQFLLSAPAPRLRIGLSLVLGGILGNVLDRILFGYVRDFLILRIGTHASPIFNLADLIQWIGYGLVIADCIKHHSVFWPVAESRGRYWINPEFQRKYCFILIATGLGISLTTGAFSYAYLRVILSQMSGFDSAKVSQVLTPFILTYFLIVLLFLVVLAYLGVVLSLRIAGPIYAFQRFVKTQSEGRESTLKLRSGDEFKELEKLAQGWSSLKSLK